MEHRYQTYHPAFKEAVVRQVEPGSEQFGFRATAKRFDIRGGHRLVARWFAHRDDLAEKRTGHRRAILTPRERAKTIADYIDEQNRAGVVVNYRDVHQHVVQTTKKPISRKRVSALGLEDGITYKKTKRSLYRDGMTVRLQFVDSPHSAKLCFGGLLVRNESLQAQRARVSPALPTAGSS